VRQYVGYPSDSLVSCCDICHLVCLSITYLSVTQYWNVIESFVYFSGKLYPYASSEWRCDSKIKRSKVKVTGNENVNFSRISRITTSKVDRFTQAKIKISSGPFYTYNFEYISAVTARRASLVVDGSMPIQGGPN